MAWRITHQNGLGQKLWLATNSERFIRWTHRIEHAVTFEQEHRVKQLHALLQGRVKKVAIEVAGDVRPAPVQRST